MSLLTEQLSPADLQKIEASVAEAERATSGEIVPVIVARCNKGHFAFWILAVSWIVVFSVFDVLIGHRILSVPFGTVLVVLGVIVCWAVAKQNRVWRSMTPKSVLKKSAWLRAGQEFYGEKISATRDRTGVLIFVALVDRQVVVMGDEAINAKVLPGTWQAVVEEILAGIRDQSLAQGLCAGIRRAGQILNEHFPSRADDTNELKNHLRLRDE